MKICIKCQLEKENENFHKDKRNKDSLSKYCKSCKKEYDIIYRQTDKIQNIQKTKEYRNRKKEYKKYRFEKDPREQLLISAKFRAKKNNLPFNLEISDIIIPEICPILEIKLERKEYGLGQSFQPNSPSLDKIIPQLGYVKGNIIVMSMKANIMKANATKEELINFSKNILKIFN